MEWLSLSPRSPLAFSASPAEVTRSIAINTPLSRRFTVVGVLLRSMDSMDAKLKKKSQPGDTTWCRTWRIGVHRTSTHLGNKSPSWDASHVKNVLNYFLVQHFCLQNAATPSIRSIWTFWPNSSIVGVEQGESFKSWRSDLIIYRQNIDCV